MAATVINLIIIACLSKLLIFSIEIVPKIFLSSTDYGEFAYFMTQVVLFSNVISYGGQNTLVKDYNPSKNTIEPFLKVLVVSTFILFSFLMIGVFVEVPLLPLFSAYFLALILNLSSYYRCNNKTIAWYVTKDYVRSVLFISFVILFHILNMEANLLYLYALSLFISACYLMSRIVLKSGFLSYFEYSFQSLFSVVTVHFKRATPIIFTGFTYILLSRIDSFFVKSNLGYEVLGDYSSVSRIMYQSLFVQQIMMGRYMHKISSFFSAEEYDRGVKLSRFICWKMCLSTVVISLIILVSLNIPYVEELFGFGDVTVVAIIFMFGHVVYALLCTNGYMLLFCNHQYYGYFNSLLILLVSIGLNSLLIPQVGIVGAAVSTVSAIILGNVLELIQFKYVYNKKLRVRNENLSHS